jgi:predicted CXXCH cytochrome family protein
MRNLVKTLAVVAIIAPTFAMAAISGSLHDLSPGNVNANVKSAAVGAGGTDQLCIFCHTPHRAGVTNLLWNRYSASVTAKWNSTTNKTTAGTPLPTTVANIGLPSKACLSCHDGSVAIGAVTNFGGTARTITMQGTFQTGGQLNSGSANLLGVNLDGNHPVSVPYGAGNTYNGSASAALSGDFQTAGVGVACSGAAFCASASGTGKQIPLYGAGSGTLGIECTSCHDPHLTTNGKFLRVSNNASALCLACHVK